MGGTEWRLVNGEYGECCWVALLGYGLMNDLALSSRQKVKLETVRYSSNSNKAAAIQAGTLRLYIVLWNNRNDFCLHLNTTLN